MTCETETISLNIFFSVILSKKNKINNCAKKKKTKKARIKVLKTTILSAYICILDLSGL